MNGTSGTWHFHAPSCLFSLCCRTLAVNVYSVEASWKQYLYFAINDREAKVHRWCW